MLLLCQSQAQIFLSISATENTLFSDACGHKDEILKFIFNIGDNNNNKHHYHSNVLTIIMMMMMLAIITVIIMLILNIEM